MRIVSDTRAPHRFLERAAIAEEAPRLGGVQAARGIAALAVVVTHSLTTPMKVEGGVVTFPGLYGVALFFVISGYIMVRTTGDARFDPKAFMGRRLRRIVPLYYLASATLALAALVLPYSFKTTTLDPAHIVKSLLFIPSWAPRAPDEILPFYKLGWTLNMEMFFYVVFASLSFLAASRRIWMITLFFAALVVAGRAPMIHDTLLRFYTYPIILGFVAGMWLARVRLELHTRLSRAAAAALFAASLVSLAEMARHYELFARDELLFVAWLTLTVTAQMAVTLFYVDRGGVHVPAWLRAIGDASYSLYLFHMFAIAAAFTIVRTFAPDQLALSVVVAVVSGSMAGLIVHRLVEAPLMIWLDPPGRTRAARGARTAA